MGPSMSKPLSAEISQDTHGVIHAERQLPCVDLHSSKSCKLSNDTQSCRTTVVTARAPSDDEELGGLQKFLPITLAVQQGKSTFTFVERQESCGTRSLRNLLKTRRIQQVLPAEGREITNSHRGLTMASRRNQWKTRPLIRTKSCRSRDSKPAISEPVLLFCFRSPLPNDGCKTREIIWSDRHLVLIPKSFSFS
ncbi:unnamed protein product [Prunus armeniaca]|uniref:Uncharacterized protein n=1 Tax=Prunus armeniaca TaxID=36596 RepID=A0A6J5VNW5_PRUAR|nr:unnamed protein product [Prunus armeniaca]